MKAGPLQILFVEDALSDYLLIERHLLRHGLAVECRRIASTEELDEALAASWDLVLSDYNVPTMDFQTTLHRIRGHMADVPVILISGSLGEETAVDLLRLGVTDFVLKGNLLRLVPAIRRALEEAAERQARRMAEEEQRKAELSLRRAQKMDALGQLTSGIAHDVNNVLGIISANLQLIEMDPSAENIEESVRTALSAVNRGADLLRRLLAFARWRSDSIVPGDVGREISEVRPLIEKALPKTVTLTIAVPDDLWPARMESSGFGDAILNLALNAAQAMPVGVGQVTIRASNVVLDGKGSMPATELARGEYVLVACSDNGSGIPPDIMDKVFEPFFTTKPRPHGSGLGLSMVYGFCRRCGGTARIYSELGRGTTVRLYLPRAETSANASRTEQAGPVPVGRGQTILLVDDEVGLLRATGRYLEEMNYIVVTADTPEDAITLAARTGQIDLLFSDIMMPGAFTGIQLARALQDARPGLKVLLTTGFTESAQMPGQQMADYPIMHKPYRFEDLARTIDALLSAR